MSRLERYAFIKHKEAEQVRAAYGKAIAKHELDERIYDRSGSAWNVDEQRYTQTVLKVGELLPLTWGIGGASR